ncbi:PREDICTED: uncharacterized protein C9orf171 homolog [Chaetura pelagica]|uniref:uncharacterized protein C9orf171 homolog n=1 Tax=Chaetura pelagica TaxID=8897 RepID=UPI0005234B46|nr:PREDICTED: uncharacterized protein C9orf171 homolog [Chaetura pelagica]
MSREDGEGQGERSLHFFNFTLVQAEVGKPRRNCYTLPGFDFAYGLYIERTDGGVPGAIGHWNTAKPRINIDHEMPRDFITMNIAALKDGCRTAHEFNLYYKAKDTRCKRDDSRRRPPKLPADMTYGKPTRTCTPLIDLLQHKYKELWMEQQRALTVHEETDKKKIHKLRDNRTTFLRKHPAPPQEESFWHLPSLEKVEPHLNTFPSREAREKALSASQ